MLNTNSTNLQKLDAQLDESLARIAARNVVQSDTQIRVINGKEFTVRMFSGKEIQLSELEQMKTDEFNAWLDEQQLSDSVKKIYKMRNVIVADEKSLKAAKEEVIDMAKKHDKWELAKNLIPGSMMEALTSEIVKAIPKSETPDEGLARVKKALKVLKTKATKAKVPVSSFKEYQPLLDELAILTHVNPTAEEIQEARDNKKKARKDARQQAYAEAAKKGLPKPKIGDINLEDYPEYVAARDRLEYLKNQTFYPIFKPVLNLPYTVVYKRVTRKWLDGSKSGKGKAGHREMLGDNLLVATPIIKEYRTPKTNKLKTKITHYDILVKELRTDLTIPTGQLMMAISFIKMLTRKGAFSNNPLYIRDKHGYTLMVQYLASEVGLDISEHCGWVTNQSYRKMNAFYYAQTYRKQDSKILNVQRERWVASAAYKILRKWICKAIRKVIRDWGNSNPAYAEDVKTFYRGYARKTIKFLEVCSIKRDDEDSVVGTRYVYNFDKFFTKEELDQCGVDYEVLKLLANEVVITLQKDKGSQARAIDELNIEIDKGRSEHELIEDVRKEETHRNVGHKITANLDGFTEVRENNLASVDNHGGLMKQERLANDLVSITEIDGLDEEATDLAEDICDALI